ncbi:hypothetical protein EV643_12091 [Kribbella sp. VKM Ac-2527]|uniref:Uncharacterized protein n=1 Tax=Kribbella caucasensis TaxID=2512215 RepID=A0A4R6JJK1_9ACTN|nr:hypothetical protein [Kribbella sp. VKM Ac-2527]TDO36360.1 hypothetical protein EV643_12091 [Kribbella sp. VKM Ac-2527]
MNENRLTQELEREAAAVRVDVDRMWDDVQQRTVGKTVVNPSVRPWRRRLTPYLAAASVATVLVAAGAFLTDPDEPPVSSTTPPPTTKITKIGREPVTRPGPIGDWVCPDRTVIQPGKDSMTFKPIRAVLDPAKAPPEAIAYGVPRYRYTLSGATGVLDYGDATGRRISRTELTRTTTGWLVGKRTVCSGPGGRPSPDPVALGAHTAAQLPFDPRSAQVKATPIIGKPLLIDDRTYYDPAGMLRHATLYAFETKGGYQFASVPADDESYQPDALPEDMISGGNLVQPTGADETYIFAGSAPFFGTVLSYLTDDKTVESLSVRSASDGATGPAQRFTFPGGRTLYTVVPVSQLDGDTLVTVHRTTGDEPPRRF